MPRKFVALDTRFLLALEKGEPDCEGALDFFSQLGLFGIITETVRKELSDLEFNSANPEVKRVAAAVLRKAHLYNILSPDLADVDRSISELIAARLLERGIIAGGTLDDARVIAEAGLQNCLFLLTDREVLTEADPEVVRMILISQDVGGCFILPLRVIPEMQAQIEAFRRQPRRPT